MKAKRNGSFAISMSRDAIDHLTVHVTLDTKSPPAQLLDEKPKGRKKTIPLIITQPNTPVGPKAHRYHVTNWKSIQNMEIKIDINSDINTGPWI